MIEDPKSLPSERRKREEGGGTAPARVPFTFSATTTTPTVERLRKLGFADDEGSSAAGIPRLAEYGARISHRKAWESVPVECVDTCHSCVNPTSGCDNLVPNHS